MFYLSRTRELAIKAEIREICELVPYEVCKGSRIDKSLVLKKAAEYIEWLQEEIRFILGRHEKAAYDGK